MSYIVKYSKLHSCGMLAVGAFYEAVSLWLLYDGIFVDDFGDSGPTRQFLKASAGGSVTEILLGMVGTAFFAWYLSHYYRRVTKKGSVALKIGEAGFWLCNIKNEQTVPWPHIRKLTLMRGASVAPKNKYKTMLGFFRSGVLRVEFNRLVRLHNSAWDTDYFDLSLGSLGVSIETLVSELRRYKAVNR